MHTLIADVTITRIPKPVPVIKEAVFAEGNHWRGTAEFIPINTGRHRFNRCVANRLPAFKAETLGHIDLAYNAIPEQSDGADLVGCTSAL